MDGSDTYVDLEGGEAKSRNDLGAEGISDFIEAAGLVEYDQCAISNIYKGHPKRLIKRLWQTLVPITLFIIGVAIDKVLGLLEKKSQAKKRSKELAELLVALGPAFIKAGQALSTRPDIVPTIILEELSQLQDQLPGFESNLAMLCIEEDLNCKVKDIFLELESEPISAASLGQVHKGVLKDGSQVAVKIQRPGLREQITLDLYIVRNIANWLNKNIGLIRSDLVALVDELGKRIFQEMDYINEANNAEKFRELHSHNPKIKVPKVFKHASSRRVLTMEWIDGVKLTKLDAIQKLGIDRDEMVNIGVNCSLQQLLEHGFFHADPHPGNLLALPNGKLCYLDFGMMSEVRKESRNGLIQAVVHLVNKDFDALSKDFVELGFLEEKVNLKPIVPAFESVFSQAVDMGVNKLDFKSVTDDLSGVMYKFPFKIPAYYALIIRSLITLEGIALSVDPNFKILGAAYPYFAKRLMEDNDPKLRKSLKDMIFEKNNIKWERLENLIKSASSQTDLNIEKLIDQVMDFLFSANGGILRKELVNTTVQQIDLIGWKTLKQINQKLTHKALKNDEVQFRRSQDILNLDPIKEFIAILKTLPGFKMEMIISKLPRLFIEPKARKMGFDVARGVTEKGIIRLVKVAAGVDQ